MNIEEAAMPLKDRVYFAQRLAAEQALARAAASRVICAIHLELARAYEARLFDADRPGGSPRHASADHRRSFGEAR